MKIILKQMLLSCMATVLLLPSAHAINELDFPELGTGISFMIEQVMKEIETQTGTNLHESDEKHQQADGNEGKYLFWDKVKSSGKNYLKNTAEKAKDMAINQAKSGNFNIKDLTSGLAEGALSELPDITAISPSDLINLGKEKLKAKKDLKDAEEELKSVEEAELEERKAKIKEIKSELNKYATAIAALPPDSPDRMEYGVIEVQLRQQLADLEANEDSTSGEQEVSGDGQNAPSNNEEAKKGTQEQKEGATASKPKKKKNSIAKKYEAAKAAAIEKIAAAKEQYDTITKALDTGKKFQELQKKTDEYMDKIFGGEEEEKEVEDIYTQVINDFFLEEDEIVNSENISRVAKNRKRAYYLALHDLLTTATYGDGMILQTREDAKNMRESITDQADTNFGAKNMQIGVDFQIIRSAAQLTKMLLAKIRMETLQQIQDWNDFYKLNDYSQDFTVFNLDNYKFHPGLGGKLKAVGKSLLGKAKNIAKQQVNKTAQSVKDSAMQKITGSNQTGGAQ